MFVGRLVGVVELYEVTRLMTYCTVLIVLIVSVLQRLAVVQLRFSAQVVSQLQKLKT